jgi:hypothetical protein
LPSSCTTGAALELDAELELTIDGELELKLDFVLEFTVVVVELELVFSVLPLQPANKNNDKQVLMNTVFISNPRGYILKYTVFNFFRCN